MIAQVLHIIQMCCRHSESKIPKLNSAQKELQINFDY